MDSPHFEGLPPIEEAGGEFADGLDGFGTSKITDKQANTICRRVAGVVWRCYNTYGNTHYLPYICMRMAVDYWIKANLPPEVLLNLTQIAINRNLQANKSQKD